MQICIGYYGDMRAELLDLVQETCRLLGGELICIDSLDIPPLDILLWNFVAPINKTTHAWLHHRFNVYLLRERGENIKRYSSYVDPEAFYEEYLVIPFDPEELALRIVTASYRRQHHLLYQFDPVFYAIYQELIDTHIFPSK